MEQASSQPIPASREIPGISPRTKERSTRRTRRLSSWRTVEVTCMVVPFGESFVIGAPGRPIARPRPSREHPCHTVHGYHLLESSHGPAQRGNGGRYQLTRMSCRGDDANVVSGSVRVRGPARRVGSWPTPRRSAEAGLRLTPTLRSFTLT